MTQIPKVPVSGNFIHENKFGSLHQFLVKDHQKEEPFYHRYMNLNFNYDSDDDDNWSTWDSSNTSTDPDLCLGIIGQSFDCSEDNQALESRMPSKWQRRRANKHIRKHDSRYATCEFGSNIPIDDKPISTYLRRNINTLCENSQPSVGSISAVSTSTSKSSNQKIKGSRTLNPNNKKDCQRLIRLKRNLEALKRMSNHSNCDHAMRMYKQLSGKPVQLKTVNSVSLPAHDFRVIPLRPENTGQLRDKLWVAHQCDKPANTKTGSIQIMSTIIDKTVSERKCICVYNLTSELIDIPEGEVLCEAYELHYSVIPVMDSTLIQEIERNEPSIHSMDQDSNLSPKAEKEAEFNGSIESVTNTKLRKMLVKNKSVFVPSHDYVLDKIDIPPIKLGTINQQITPTPPPARRHFSDKHDDAISTHITVGLMNGLIQRQQSPTVSPMHAVEQNGKVRIVMDSRKVNEQLEMYNYIFPKISEEVEELASGKFTVFSQTDLTSAFNQIEIHEDSRFLLAFAVHTKKYRGTFSYTRLPFGIKPAPAIFASVLDRILEGINDTANGRFLIKSFIDDIVIGAVNEEAMLEALRLLFARLICFNIKLSIVKSKFCRPSASYCGIEISRDGYTISPKRKKILEQYPDFDVRTRKKNNDLRHLGFYNWHRRFVENYAKHDRDLRNTIKRYKNKELTAEVANATIKEITDTIKQKILNTMLVTPTKGDILTMHCDASGDAWGYVLSCDRGVIAYGGGAFTETTQKSHNVFEKETMAMSNSLSDTYKLASQGKSLIIKNDNLSLITINKSNKVTVTPRMIKYLTNIVVLSQQLPSKFIHLNTLENYLADILSRLEYNDDGTIKVNMMSADGDVKYSSLYYFYDCNEKHFFESTNHSNSSNECTLMSLHQPPNIITDDKVELMEYYRRLHRNFHWSVEKTVKSCTQYAVPVDRDLIEEVWLECEFCQEYKKSAPLAKLKFRENPHRPFEEIHIDHIIKRNEHKSSHGYTAALTMKCALTRYMLCYPMKDVQITNVVKELRNCFMALGRIPSKIYADNAFDASTMHTFCEANDIQIAFRASNLSRSVSVESSHRRLHEKIKSMLGRKQPSLWHEVAWKAAMSMNCQVHGSIGFTPYYLFHGHQPEFLGTKDVPHNVRRDKYWEYDLKLAKSLADNVRLQQSDNYKYPTFMPGDRLQIRADNNKNAKPLYGEIVEDQGGATAVLKLDGRHKPLPFHKGMLFAKKLSPEWRRLTGATRSFDDLINRNSSADNSSSIASEEPIARRLRQR